MHRLSFQRTENFKVHLKNCIIVILWFILDIMGFFFFFVWPRSFSYFSVQGSEKGGEADPTQKATLFPSGSVLHPSMNGVLKNTTLGTRLFFILHNWAVCLRVSRGLVVQTANGAAMVLRHWAGVKIPTSQLDVHQLPCVPLAFCTSHNRTMDRTWMKTVSVALLWQLCVHLKITYRG